MFAPTVVTTASTAARARMMGARAPGTRVRRRCMDAVPFFSGVGRHARTHTGIVSAAVPARRKAGRPHSHTEE